MSEIKQDMTTGQLADRVAQTISAFTAQAALRLAHTPHSPVTADEREAYDAMRVALREMATTEYDRGYRTAMRFRRGDDRG